MERYEKPVVELILFDLKEEIATGDGLPDTELGTESDMFGGVE